MIALFLALSLGDVQLVVSSNAEAVLTHAEKAASETSARIAKKGGDAKEIRARLLANVAANLREKKISLDAGTAKRTVVDYEMFKAEAFVTGGVFPKRYFGYLDQRHDTAKYETKLISLANRSAEIANARQKRRGSAVRVNALEIAVTFLSEGGAILLREHQDQLESIHPVFGVGLDDVGEGFELHADLVKEYDEAFGVGLATIAKRDGGEYRGATLTRNFTFDEAVLGTAVMWVFEKEIAERKMRAAEKRGLEGLSLDEQFIAGSLVYNSGLLFAADRREMIRTFTTGPYLADVSANVKQRDPLPLLDPKRSIAMLVRWGYPEQPTSWAAVYHVLQRYGGWTALRRFADVADDEGRLR